MASAQGFVSGLNIHVFLNDEFTDWTMPAGNPAPNTEDIGTKAGDEGASKLVSTGNLVPGIVTLGTEDKTANSIEFFIFGQSSSERIPGIASTQQFTLSFAMKYNEAVFAKWRQKTTGDIIEGAIITNTGSSTDTLQAVTGLRGSNYSLVYFKGKLSGTSFNFGTQSEPAQMSFTIDLEDPMVSILDATS